MKMQQNKYPNETLCTIKRRSKKKKKRMSKEEKKN